MQAADLTERIRLLKRQRWQNDDGDLQDTWHMVAHVPAKIRLQSQKIKMEKHHPLIYCVSLRPVTQEFQQIEWNGQHYALCSLLHYNRWTNELKFFMSLLLKN